MKILLHHPNFLKENNQYLRLCLGQPNALSSSFSLKGCNDSKSLLVFKLGLVLPCSLICSNKSLFQGLPKFFPSFLFSFSPISASEALNKSLVVGYSISNPLQIVYVAFSLCSQLKHCNLAFSSFRYFQQLLAKGILCKSCL